MPETFQFGLLDQPTRAVPFGLGELRPLVPDIPRRLQEWGEKCGHTDGWVYPATFGWKRFVGPSGAEVEQGWPQSEPKPELWCPEPTHELIWTHPDHGDGERHLPAIAINALGWAYGNRVQFADWRVDGRVRWKCSPSFGLRVVHVEHFLNRVMEIALTLRGKQVEVLTALILHNRAPIHTWDWERHHWQYVVLDSCWRLLHQRGLVPKEAPGGHAKRIAAVCDRLGIPRLPEVEARIVAQRNDLAHQGLWCEGVPGYQGTTEAHYDYFRIRKLVDRLLLHLFGIECGLRTRSWDIGEMMAETMEMPEVEPGT